MVSYVVQIGESAGLECKAAIQETNQLVEQKYATNKKEVKAQFGAAEVDFPFNHL